MKKILIFSFLGLLSISNSALATDLIDVYKQALRYDPTYLAAYSTMLSNQETLPQSVAQLLPNIFGSANSFGNYVNVIAVQGFDPNLLAPGEVSPLGVFRVNTNNYTLTAQQTLFNFTQWWQVKQGSWIFKQAAATFCAATQDLMVRVARTYLAVLEAQDTLTYTEAQKLANGRELDQTRERYKVGLDAITSVYNAQASYDSILAEEIAAKNNVANALESLRQLTGICYDHVEALKIELPLVRPDPECPEKWVEVAGCQNKTVMAARYAAEAARANIKANFGGHLPVFTGVASYSHNKVPFEEYNQGMIGVQVNVPLFQGGYVVSKVRQAQDDFSTRTAEMLSAYRQATTSTRQNFNNMISGLCKVQADRAAILSAQSSLDSTQESFKVGTRTIVDVLLAQQQLYNVRTNYAKDEYAYLLSALQLKQSAGTLTPCDLMRINEWLHGPDQRNLQQFLQPPPIGNIEKTDNTNTSNEPILPAAVEKRANEILNSNEPIPARPDPTSQQKATNQEAKSDSKKKTVVQNKTHKANDGNKKKLALQHNNHKEQKKIADKKTVTAKN